MKKGPTFAELPPPDEKQPESDQDKTPVPSGGEMPQSDRSPPGRIDHGHGRLALECETEIERKREETRMIFRGVLALEEISGTFERFVSLVEKLAATEQPAAPAPAPQSNGTPAGSV